ncbi:hypothetical protein FRB98_009194 [Tulasnella sp. 332]|nr:hypothetical protein FRB98_009194 [Tulasnella sp. 332]
MSNSLLGLFTLTTTLLPLIKTTAVEPSSEMGVITLSSVARLTATIKVDWKTADGWNFKSLIGTLKLANVLFAKELQRLFDEQGVNALSIAIPSGEVDTSGLEFEFEYSAPTTSSTIIYSQLECETL